MSQMLRSLAEVAFVQSKLAAATGGPTSANNEQKRAAFMKRIGADDCSFIAEVRCQCDNLLTLALFLTQLP